MQVYDDLEMKGTKLLPTTLNPNVDEIVLFCNGVDPMNVGKQGGGCYEE